MLRLRGTNISQARQIVKVRQIEAFKAVIETGSVTAASRRLSLTQPAVSKLIVHLERSIGMTLFERSKARLKPTPEATIFYEYVSRSFAILENLVVVAKEIKALRRGTITVGCLPMLSNAWLSRQCVQFAKGRPDVDITVQTQSSGKILEWVSSGQVDVGLGMLSEDPDVNAEPISSVELVCVLPPGHQLAAKQVIAPADFDGQSFVAAGLDVSREKITALFRTYDVKPKAQFDAILGSTTCNFVAAGGGMSLVNAASAFEYQHLGYEIRRFRPELRFKIYLITSRHKTPSALVEEFCARMRRELGPELASLSERLPPPG
jgi:DNA-binding transcriptional LysR family regulator